MTRFNLSEWALRHRSFVVYCMLVLLIAGALFYSRLGRNEDPAFTFRHGRARRLARRHPRGDARSGNGPYRADPQGNPSPRFPAQLHPPRQHDTIFVNLKGSTPPREVPDIWYHVRKSVGDMRHTLPAPRRARMSRASAYARKLQNNLQG